MKVLSLLIFDLTTFSKLEALLHKFELLQLPLYEINHHHGTHKWGQYMLL
jgi:hypothetical protein